MAGGLAISVTDAVVFHCSVDHQESEELPADFTTLFNHQLFGYDNGVVPETVAAYEVWCA